MKEKDKLRFVLVFTIGYLILFTVLAVLRGNYEFLYYTLVITQLMVLIAALHKRMHLTTHIIIGLSVLGFLHVAGGNVHIAGVRLYDMHLIGEFFKFDNLVHALGILIATFVGYNLLAPHLDRRIKYNGLLLGFILVSIAMGIGVFNELLEFGAVVFLNAAEAAGDYFNNALDLFFNLIGAIVAVFFIHTYHAKQLKRK